MWNSGVIFRVEMKIFLRDVSCFIREVVKYVVRNWEDNPQNWPSFNELLFKINERAYKSLSGGFNAKDLTDLKGITGPGGIEPPCLSPQELNIVCLELALSY